MGNSRLVMWAKPLKIIDEKVPRLGTDYAA
jgi:hypothetical protein